jgi:hypothetical protein
MGMDFFSGGEMDEFAELVGSAMSTTIQLEAPTGVGASADYAVRGRGIPARKQRLRTNIVVLPTGGPSALGARDNSTYILQTDLPVRSNWRLTDELTGERLRVLGNLTDAGWPYVQLRCEAWGS